MHQSSNTASRIENSDMEASIEGQRGVVRFLKAEGVRGTDIHRRMSQVYGEDCMSLAKVKAWHKRIRDGQVSLAYDAQAGAPHRITDDIVQLVDALLTQDRRVTVKAVAAVVGLSVVSVHTIMNERLHLRNVCVQRVPHSLQPYQEAYRMAHYLDRLLRYARERKGMRSLYEWWPEMTHGVITSNQNQNDSGSIHGPHYHKNARPST